MTMITVTASHIAAGTRDEACSCPVVLALSDACPAAGYIEVDTGVIIISTSSGEADTEIRTPDEVREFIIAFDSGREVCPFMFELDYPAVTR